MSDVDVSCWLPRLERAARDRPMPWPALAAAVRIRARPDDFVVEERPAFDPETRGAGDEAHEHFWVEIEKRGENTEAVARALARAVGGREVDVGYAGRKDRHARTRQWFSLRWPHAARPWRRCAPLGSDPLRFAALETASPATTVARRGEERDAWCAAALAYLNGALRETFPGPSGGDEPAVVALRGHWHHRKLQTGYLSGNRFRIVFELEPDARGWPRPEDVDARAQAIRTAGVPNYFGDQRFGRRNLSEGLGRLASIRTAKPSRGGVGWASAEGVGRQRVRRNRTQDGMAWSALRSAVFNAVLAARVRAGSWATPLPGERVQREGHGGFFVWWPEDADRVERETLMQRCVRGDVHPSGPLVGRVCGRRETAPPPEVERAVVAAFQPVVDGLAALGLEAARRPLRVAVGDLRSRMVDAQAGRYEWSFDLAPGAFATTVLEALAPVRDLARERRTPAPAAP